MKKVLLASAALLALGTVAQAAEPVKLSIGGYAQEWAGVATNQNDAVFSSTVGPNGAYGSTTSGSAANKRASFDVQDDVNINFVGSTKLDNGITIGVEVDTFGSQRQDSRTNPDGNTDVKRSFVTVGTVAGTAIIGEREDALYIVHNSAPDVGIGLQDGAWYQWVANPSHHKLYTATNTSRYDDRTNKLSYVSPSYYGFAAAASYVPDISRTNGAGTTSMPSSSDVNGALNGSAYTACGGSTNSCGLASGAGSVNGADFGTGDLYGAGLAYANTIGGVSIKADAGVGQANIANLRVYQGGLQISYAGFTLGGSILNRNVSSSATLGGADQGAETQALAYAGQSFDVGLSYTTGPYAVSLGTFHDTTKKWDTTDGYAADSTNVYMLSGKYILGTGVALQASIGDVKYYASYKLAADSSQENNGWLGLTGIRVDF